MPKKPDAVTCRACGHRFEDVYKLSFLGFRKYKCPGCGKKVLYPVLTRYLVVYWLMITIFSILTVAALIKGYVVIPGVLVVVGIPVVVGDICIRREVKRVESEEQSAPPPDE